MRGLYKHYTYILQINTKSVISHLNTNNIFRFIRMYANTVFIV